MKFRAATTFLVLLVTVVSYMSIKLVYVAWELERVRGQELGRMTSANYILVSNGKSIWKSTHLGNETSANRQFLSHPSFAEFVSVNCKAIFEGDVQTLEQAKNMKTQLHDNLYSDQAIHMQTQNCEEFRRYHGYNYVPTTKEETDFPIAYSIVFHKDIAQVNMLLKAIYRPLNLYCLHLDAYSGNSIRSAAKSLAACFSNVFLASRSEYVTYGGFSRLRADINCMQDLLSKTQKWKYMINLPGQEYPLKTNLELVKILKIYNGSNDIEGITGKRMLPIRYQYKHKYVSSKSGKSVLIRTGQLKEKPPYNITIVKGSAYGVFSKEFVRFVVKTKISKEFLQWCKDISSPDEYFWATLHHNTHLGTPGGYSGPPDKKSWLATYASWGGRDQCAGKWVHGVCVFGVGDLPSLMTKKEMFANKFYLDYQPVALHCMEEWIHNKTAASLPFDSMYYRALPFVKKPQ
ncbi:N-acetyllactosaminide beta-1,6-N-acetylglucosaminyl-transferase-like [Gigantopelta aegis]|uniref:N-acetyllactosaminide beta-1,6-N-acetylglucosaminyl-transferase-like n=1 Tax=Gigantopelta aegis TaxID=1735272 RepID=UPI001B887C85|nr:N-acetyllactosaminide beta-1,6-N-acetylglucosaminyl-transferase-like [Gigantopelta aegis]